MGQSIEMISQQSEQETNKHNIEEYNSNNFIKPTIESQLTIHNQIDTNTRNNQNQIQNVLNFNSNLKVVNYDSPQRIQVQQQLRQQNFPNDSIKTGVGSPKPNQVGTVLLYGIPIVSLYIESQERLCLAQISNTLLKLFSYNEIHNRRVALGITCVQCTPVQLEILRRAGAMPASSRRCGMITKREAERLCKSFLGDNAPPRLPDDFAFNVHHECAWGCSGAFLPARYNSSRAKCIKCNFCGLFFSPNKFIFHSHRIGPGDKYIQPDAANFNSWRRHMKLSANPPEDIIYAWEDVKAMFNGGTRKRLFGEAANMEQRNCSFAGKKYKEVLKAEKNMMNLNTQIVPVAANSNAMSESSNGQNNLEIVGAQREVLDNREGKTSSPGQILLENQVAINFTESQQTNLAAVVAASRITAGGTSIADFRIPFSSNFMMDYMLAQQQQRQPQSQKNNPGNFPYPNYPLPLVKVRQQQNNEKDSNAFDLGKSIVNDEKISLDIEKFETVFRKSPDKRINNKVFENSAFKPVKSSNYSQINQFKNHSQFSSAAVLATASILKKISSSTFIATTSSSQQHQQSIELKSKLPSSSQTQISPRIRINNREDQKFNCNEFPVQNREISSKMKIPNVNVQNFARKQNFSVTQQNFSDIKESFSSISSNSPQTPLNLLSSAKINDDIRIDVIDEVDSLDQCDLEDEDVLVDIETTEEDENLQINNYNFVASKNVIGNNIKDEKAEKKKTIHINYESTKTDSKTSTMDSSCVEFIGDGKSFKTNALEKISSNDLRNISRANNFEFGDSDSTEKQRSFLNSVGVGKPEQNYNKKIDLNEVSNNENFSFDNEKTKKFIEINFNNSKFLLNCDSEKIGNPENEQHNKGELINESLWLNSDLYNDRCYRSSATFSPISTSFRATDHKTPTQHGVS